MDAEQHLKEGLACAASKAPSLISTFAVTTWGSLLQIPTSGKGR